MFKSLSKSLSLNSLLHFKNYKKINKRPFKGFRDNDALRLIIFDQLLTHSITTQQECLVGLCNNTRKEVKNKMKIP